MSYFQTQDQRLEEPERLDGPAGSEAPEAPDPPDLPEAPDDRAPVRSPGVRLAEIRDRIARAVSSFERGNVDQLELEAGEASPAGVVDSGPSEPDMSARFPVGPFGYNRTAVDEYVAELERELAGVRRELPGGMTINEEIERIGEQTSSILVVAHDQARETTRRAQEQADRCIADAASNAVATTEQARRRLAELDNETDAVWQERARLLEDARATGSALIALAAEAAERFPEEAKAADTLRG